MWSDRKKKLMVPLFPNYVFINGTEEERKLAIQNNIGALKYIFYNKRPAIITPAEINNIKIMITAPDRVRLENYKDKSYEIGDYVKVTDGMFCGLTGFITQVRGKYKLIVEIVEIATALSLELSITDIKLLKRV